jgi:hypothetical protein
VARKRSGKAIERVDDLSVDAFRSPVSTWLSPSSISPTFLVTGASILYGAAFQLGYFSHVGMHFLQLAGPLDILFVLAAIVPIFFLLWPLLNFVQKAVDHHLEHGKSKIVEFSFSWLKYEYLALIALVLFYVFFEIDLTNAFQLIALVVTIVLCLLNWAALKEHYSYFLEIAPRPLMWFSVNAFLLFWVSGSLYARNIAGQECFVRTNEKAFWHARYLRSIGDGHLLIYNKQTIFLAKDELKEMFCGTPRAPEPAIRPNPAFDEQGRAT